MTFTSILSPAANDASVVQRKVIPQELSGEATITFFNEAEFPPSLSEITTATNFLSSVIVTAEPVNIARTSAREISGTSKPPVSTIDPNVSPFNSA